MLTRRHFLRNGAALVTLGAAVPAVFRRSLLAGLLDGVAAAESLARSLVIVQLAGGNDGLNTIIPYSDGTYRTLRPNLGVPEGQIIPLDSRVGLHPKLAPLASRWQAGQLAIVEGVGYPSPNLSHFQSILIWQTANPDGRATDGWAGRYLAALEQQEHDPFHGFNIGTAPSRELSAAGASVVSAANASDYALQSSGNQAEDQARQQTLLKLYESYPAQAPYGALLETTLEDALQTSAEVQQISASYQPAVQYPQNPFASGLQFLAGILAAKPTLRVAHITIGGFDTHSRQQADHEQLLETVAGGLDAFLQDLEAHNRADGVVVMTWSEFGRRPGENASLGTDHGTAAPLFVLGKPVKGGFYGEPTSLTGLDNNGNLSFTTDFRSVYATVLENWLGADSSAVLGERFTLLGFL
ncbi:MAG TPA: DUF1501 domain-containing protein [Dehalococcoidia bacterium]|nr:DUF1501 domain-containing protein [Dehalococcoidia bacterium]